MSISRLDRVQNREIENCNIETLKIGTDPCLEKRNTEPMIRRCLRDYSETFTTCIVGKAGEECGLLSYDLESKFDSGDLLDPEFPCNGIDVFPEDDDYRPEHVLSSICKSRIEVVVKVMLEMELSWKHLEPRVVDANFDIARCLWCYGKEEGSMFMKDKFGAEKAEEFMTIGNKLFDAI